MGSAYRVKPVVVAVVLAWLGVGVLLWPHVSDLVSAAGLQQTAQREFTVIAFKHSFKPLRIEVRRDDLVKITLRTEDIPHSFTIDEYRIAKRVNPGQTVVFEFRADEAGTFPFYCSLTIDDECRTMRGELVVTPR